MVELNLLVCIFEVVPCRKIVYVKKERDVFKKFDLRVVIFQWLKVMCGEMVCTSVCWVGFKIKWV